MLSSGLEIDDRNQYLRLYKAIVAVSISGLVLSRGDLVEWFLETWIPSYGFRALLCVAQAVGAYVQYDSTFLNYGRTVHIKLNRNLFFKFFLVKT